MNLESSTDSMQLDLGTLRFALDHAELNIMIANLDDVIIYVNKRTLEVLTEVESNLAAYLPGFKASKVLGGSIHRFHKDPEQIRRVLRAMRPGETHNAVIHPGNLTFEFSLRVLTDADNNKRGYVVNWNNVTKSYAKQAEADRLSGMIESAGSAFMICDRDFVISYCNPSLVAVMRKHQHEIQKALPSFSAETLIGSNIDIFHRTPMHQRQLLSDTSKLPLRTEVTIGTLSFGMNVTAITDKDGNRLGNAVEWVDFNDRVTYSREVERLYQAVKAGNLSDRGNIDKVSQVYRPMLHSINQIIDAIVEPIEEFQARLGQIAQGDVNALVVGDYQGEHAVLKNALNHTLNSLSELAKIAEEIAEGDLTVSVTPRSGIDTLGRAMKMIVDNLNTSLRQVLSSADEIAKGSTQIASSSQMLAQGASEQAASLEQISSSMSQLASQTESNAENARQANLLATSSRECARDGDEQMQKMTVAMTAIDDSSQNISKIIKVIDEIAFQTNLLSLNAAVEAARAGVHGKGFAVVANEVRNLAGRSAKAAKETTEMIEDSIKKVHDGIKISEKTADSLAVIVNSAGKVADLVGEIAAASGEQAEGIAQINRGLSQIEQVTQQNTATSQESASAAEELSGQAERLREQLSIFTLRRDAAPTGMPTELSPELLQAFQAFLQQQQAASFAPALAPPVAPAPAPVAQSFVAPVAPAPRAPASSRFSPAPAASVPSGQRIDPSQVIKLDDDDFGRY